MTPNTTVKNVSKALLSNFFTYAGITTVVIPELTNVRKKVDKLFAKLYASNSTHTPKLAAIIADL